MKGHIIAKYRICGRHIIYKRKLQICHFFSYLFLFPLPSFFLSNLHRVLVTHHHQISLDLTITTHDQFKPLDSDMFACQTECDADLFLSLLSLSVLGKAFSLFQVLNFMKMQLIWAKVAWEQSLKLRETFGDMGLILQFDQLRVMTHPAIGGL